MRTSEIQKDEPENDVPGQQDTRISQTILIHRETFRQFFDGLPDGAVLLDMQDRVIEVNESFLHMFAFIREEVLGQVLTNLIVPEEIQSEALALNTSVLSGHGAETVTTRKRKDGTKMEVWVKGHPLVEGGRQIGVFGTYRDIAEQRRQDLLIRLGQIAAGLAHQFNNKYQAMLMHIEHLRRRLTEQPPDTLRSVDALHHLTLAAAVIVQQMRYFTGKVTTSRERLYVPILLDNVCEEINQQAQTPVTVRPLVHVPDFWELDGQQIKHLVEYLAQLSRTANKKHPREVILIAQDAEHVPGLSRSAGMPAQRHLHLLYHDQKLVIDEEGLKHLFEPFAPLPPLLPIDGAILSLTAVQGIVQNHGGVILTESSPEEGTSFDIYLPSNPSVLPVGSKE